MNKSMKMSQGPWAKLPCVGVIAMVLLASLNALAACAASQQLTRVESLTFGGLKMGYGDRSSFVRLNRGNPIARNYLRTIVSASLPASADFVIAPEKDVCVALEKGKLNVTRGSVAYVVDTGSAIAICDLHDTSTGSISYSVNNRCIDLMPGSVLLISLHDTNELPDLLKDISIRNVSVRASGGGCCLVVSEFAIVQLVSDVPKLRALSKSKVAFERKLTESILKTAAIHQLVTASHGPFRRIQSGDIMGRAT